MEERDTPSPPPPGSLGEGEVPKTAGKVERMLMTERGNPSVRPPNWEPLPRAALFGPDGLPKPRVVREHFKREGLLSEEDALEIITLAANIWKQEPNVVPQEDPVVVCGDIHGQFYDLVGLLDICGDPSDQKYIFLGDYVDRGCFGMEAILLLMCYKICYPSTVVMLRGNHESRHLTAYFNFKREVLYKYSLAVYNAMMSAFDCLPLCCILNGRFLCVHGGLSPELQRIADINAVHRFREPPSSGPMCDLLWADPMDEKEEEPDYPQHFVPNTTRGCSYVFSHAAACRFLEDNNLVTVIRGHEAQDSGFHLYKKTSKGFPSVICIFSAPNYCDTYNNRAAVVILNKNVLNIRQYNSNPHPYYLPNYMNAFTWSLPFVAEKLLEMWSSVLKTVNETEDSLVVRRGRSPGGSPSPQELNRGVSERLEEISGLIAGFRDLYQESESAIALGGLATGAVPPELAQQEPDAIRGSLSSFDSVRSADMVNECWPPDSDGDGDHKNESDSAQA